MKATLTIEVPDDFEKGECEKCELFYSQNVCWHTTENCPLEIQNKREPQRINGYTAKECSDWITDYLDSDEIHYFDEQGHMNKMAFILWATRNLLDYYVDEYEENEKNESNTNNRSAR